MYIQYSFPYESGILENVVGVSIPYNAVNPTKNIKIPKKVTIMPDNPTPVNERGSGLKLNDNTRLLLKRLIT